MKRWAPITDFARFALTLEVSTDELLGVKPTKSNSRKPSRKVLR